MDESWRMRMGIPNGGNHRRRQSVGGMSSDTMADLEAEDFDDVFGGPPRSVLARKNSADFTGADRFYQEIFQPQEAEAPAIIAGRTLPEFLIPEQRRSKQKVKSMSKPKSTLSSILIFEEFTELGTFRPSGMIAGEEDVALSSFTSTLRPINIPSRWSSSSAALMPKSKQKNQDLPTFGCSSTPEANMDNNQFIRNECNDYMIKSFNFGFSQTVPSLETVNLEHTSLRMGDYDTQLDSPSSALSSLCQGPVEGRMTSSFIFEDIMEYQIPNVKVEAEEEVMSSYVIEFNSQTTEVNNSEAIDIDEAIAWAKEKFQGWSSNNAGVSPREQQSLLFLETRHDF